MNDDMLATATPPAWLDAVLADFDAFLLDHAANERKASALAMSLVAHYPDKQALLETMIDLALEELNHFRQVVRIVNQRGLVLGPDRKDHYVNGLRDHMQRGRDAYFLDRLLLAAVIEARGAERFALIAQSLEDDALGTFYGNLARSERNHHRLFIDLARQYFPEPVVRQRMQAWVDIESRVIASLEIGPRLH